MTAKNIDKLITVIRRITMNKFRKLLSLALVLVMLFALSVPAFAIGTKKYRHYDTYMCLGDSIAAGCALNKLEPGVEYPYDTSLADIDYERFYEELLYMYSPTCAWIYRGFFPEKVPDFDKYVGVKKFYVFLI